MLPAVPSEKRIARASSESIGYLALVEIDRFEALKRTVGYAAALRILSTLADTIRDRLPQAHAVRADRAFVEIVFEDGPIESAERRLGHLATSLARRVEIEGYGFDLSLTIGYVETRGEAVSDELVGAAERAMLAARTTIGRIARADADAPIGVVDRLTLMRALQAAIRADALCLHYQPKVDARSGEVVAVEALVRWTCPRLGTIMPDMFVPIAEETGDIRALTEWVLGRAIHDQRLLTQDGRRLQVDINISGESLGDDRFTRGLIERAADATGTIGFEITETSMIADPGRALANLRSCAAAGIGLAIDDYGSGFSSLAYLQQLPVDELKIDRGFISRLMSHQRDPLLVRSTIDLAHALEMRVTAEGIETPHVLALLQVMGCDLLQGYYLARPMPCAEMVTWLAGEGARLAVQSRPPRLAGDRGGATLMRR